MPLYGFKCDSCEHKFDEFKLVEERKIPLSDPCPKCGKIGCIIRIYDTAGFVDPGIINADKNMEKSGVLKELDRMREHHPYMKWNG